MNLFNRNKKKLRGYVYYALEEDERFKVAKVGDLIINKTKLPPWIVVDHTLDKTIVTKWPGRLFEVEILNEKQEKSINRGLIKDVWYTRTLGVKIIQELPIENLFGENGQVICKIIDLARNISEKQVNLLAEFENINDELYSKAWIEWIKLSDKNSPHLKDKHYDTLKVFPTNQKYTSPIREGLSIISSQINIRAKEFLGESAFVVDEEGEQYLMPIWSNACVKLLHAGISFESDGLLSELEKMELRKPLNGLRTKNSG